MALLYVDENSASRQKRVFRDRIGLDSLRDFEIVSRYRLDRACITELTDLLRETLDKCTKRSYSISAEIQVLVGLRYLAKGSFYSEVADIHGISRSSVCITLDAFVDAVNENLDNIRFPFDSVNNIKYAFFGKCGLPNVIGAVDGTLIPIQLHGHCCKVAGSQHDSFIFNNSGIKSALERRDIGYLLGDSGYPLRRYIVTQVLNPSSRAETAFNEHHSSGRSVVEKAFGVLKSRFRCLHRSGGCLLLKPTKCCKVVEACVRLHNFCLDRRVPFNEQDIISENDNETFSCQTSPSRGGSERRQRLINLFS